MARRLLVITSRFNEPVTKSLYQGAQAKLREAGYGEDQVDELWVPGCFELPATAARAARTGRYDAIITLGAVIRGETSHFDYVAGEAARGVMQVSLETAMPVIFGVLTTENAEQAYARSEVSRGNKGGEAVETALTMMKVMDQIDSGEAPVQ